MSTPVEPRPNGLKEGESRYFNREMSWLAFNRRVLEEAGNPAHPLLERLRFLSISGSNLDEFFSVRVAGLKEQQLENVAARSYDGQTPAQQLEKISAEADVLIAAQQRCWLELAALLGQSGVAVVAAYGLDDRERAWLRTQLAEQILPVLTPQAVDPSHPFPFVPNLGFALVFAMVDTTDGEAVSEVLMIPASVPRFIRLPGNNSRFIATDDGIAANLDLLFPGFELIGAGAFRVLRDTDIEIEEDAEDLVRTFRSAIKQRRRGRVIRLEFTSGTPHDIETLVREGVGAEHALITESAGLIGIADLQQLVEVEGHAELRFAPFTPRFPERVTEHGGDCFAAIRDKDFVVHHPYESFDVVVAFLRQEIGRAHV